jgi:glutamate-1-semialdehyde 2,1-aminomutase
MSDLWDRARAVLPGGVNSPVRAFGEAGGRPPFIRKAHGARLADEEGKEYIDYVGSWGPAILGHAHPAVLEAVEKAAKDGLSFGAATKREVEMAELVSSLVPGVEMLRMTSSGTEAAMSAVRLARGCTGREKAIKFEGCYHGHFDSMLVNAGSGALTFGVGGSAGVTEGAAKDTLTAPYGSLDAASALFAANPGQIACVLVEPLAANMGVVKPPDGFLSGLRKLCSENGALLIFDEVITGFRLALGGAQEFYRVHADVVVLGKIIGGGLPVGCYGASRQIMSSVSPLGPVYQAGTLSGNPVAMAAGFAQLSWLAAHPETYAQLKTRGDALFGGLEKIPSAPISVVWEGSLGCAFFAPSAPLNCQEAKKADTKAFASWHAHMLKEGVYLAPSQFEAIFLSAAHTPDDVDKTLGAAKRYFNEGAKQ